MTKTVRSIVTLCACAGLLGLSALTAPLAIAAPNSHANEHANSGGNGNGDGSGNGNGKSSGSAGTKGNGSTVHQYALASGLKQGDVASALKSWNSLNANPHAFLNNLNNPHSLLGKEAKYVCDSAGSQAALATFTGAGGNPASPPTQEQFDGASAYLAAVALLAGADPATVAADPGSSTEEIAAANILIANAAAATPLTSESADAIVTQFGDWQSYQAAEGTAQDSFLSASVSYKGATYSSSMSALRSSVDAIVTQKGLDASTMCAASTAVATE
jgi:hypothetical protein